MSLFLIEDSERNGAVLMLGFDDPGAALRYIHRFGRPGMRVLKIPHMTLEEVEALPSRLAPSPNEIRWEGFEPERKSA